MKVQKEASSQVIDNLSYSYNSLSNKLGYVNDAVTTDQKLVDFANKNTGTDDYSYDINGNLISDKNKDITSITYNHLNLPSLVTVRGENSNKGTIEYTYDALGTKLKKTTTEGGSGKSTLYIGGFEYLNDTLQQAQHEEGRIRLSDTLMVYDYFIKDHLGNTRAVITSEQHQSSYPPASMETANSVLENTLYENIDSTRSLLPAGYPTDSYTSPNEYVAKLNASNGKKIGPAILLKVMAGDSVHIRASSWYRLNGANPGSSVSPLEELLYNLSKGISVSGSGKFSMQELSGTILPTGINDLLTDRSSGFNLAKPKAYLSWVLLDEQFNYVSSSSGFEQVGEDTILTTWTKMNLPMQKNGYLYVYTGNESGVDVFFDNLQVTHIRGPLLEETHYYPFGLTMAGISSKAAGKLENRFKYNGAELNTAFDLNQYEFFYRTYDPQIGRWYGLDPKPMEMMSPYSAMINNPITMGDPLGDTTYRFNKLDGTYIGMYDLDAVGQVGSYGSNKTIGKGKNKQEVWDGTRFEFADPDNDSQQIRDGIINKLVFVSDDEIKNMLTEQGAFNYDDKNNPITFGRNSTGGKNFDYSYSVIPSKYRKDGASSDPLNNPSRVLFLPQGDYTAHNHMNFGNYLWGASGNTLGFSYATLQFFAHANSVGNPRRTNGYRPQLDSKDDQNSIKKGIYHASEYKYRIILEQRHKAESKNK